YGVSRRTLYRWRQKLREGGGELAALEPKSCRPKRVRKPFWPAELVAEIRRLRQVYPNIGKEKLKPLLEPFCRAHNLKVPSVSTIGRIIARDPGKMRVTPPRLSR
ncbi:MAG: helix-turn-helix domain-containing protein, partial [Thermoanaerobaculum sp.]